MAEDWINAKSLGQPLIGRKVKPNYDEKVSKIVGKNILASDPRLLKFVVDLKREKGNDESNDHFLENESNREKLKELFN